MAEVPPVRPGRVFLSYRREDAAFPAGWLYERLVGRFGRDAVFKDVDSIDLGDDWAEVIRTAVGSCDVLLAMIGREWATITDAVGRRRLEDPDDFVRLEIETALQRDVRVIPILVEGAGLPRAEQLPISLAKLVDRQALELSPYRFEHDITRLSYVLEETIAQQQSRRAAEEQATDRYAKAVEQLGSEMLDVRLGGIYALERLIGDSPRHHSTIVGVLAAFLREHATTPMEETSPESSRQKSTPPVIPMPADTAAAARAIARRPPGGDEHGPLGLRRCYLSGADLSGADLSGADLSDANLHGADLSGANLSDANLHGADLSGANLLRAYLSDANLYGANLSAANLSRAYLIRVTLRAANLTEAGLTDASLSGADLAGANLMSVKDLTREQLQLTRTVDAAVLPDYLAEDRN